MRRNFNVKALSLKGLMKHFVASVLSISLVIGLTCSFVSAQNGESKADAVSGATTKKEYKKEDKVVSVKKGSTAVKKKQVVKKASAKGTKKPSPAKA